MRFRVLLAVLGLLIAVPVALAAQEPITDVDLEAGGTAVFDPENDEPGNDACLTADIANEDAYTPVDDGFTDNDSDAFDSGLLLLVNGTSFVDADDNGNVTGEQIKVGPSTLAGLRVTRTDRALATSPTMRSLISFKNPKNKAKRVTLAIENDYGADDDEVVRGSAKAPNLFYSKPDSWVVVADDAITPSDAVVTQVFFGKGANEKVTKVTNGFPNADSCLNVRYSIKVPGKSKRHLMLFTQVHDADDVALARIRAKAFGKNKLGQKFRAGLSNGTENKILNWDLK
jgi:hypothetical protein